jgi:hypothetical protein
MSEQNEQPGEHVDMTAELGPICSLGELLAERGPKDPETARRLVEWLNETVARADAGEMQA